MFITFVTLGELTKWTVLRDWGPRRLADLADWQRHVGVLPSDEDVAATWGQLLARAQRRADLGRSTTRGSRRAAWFTGCRWRRSAPRDFADFAQYDGLELLDIS